MIASLDLSSAFDLVNVKILLKRLNIIGLLNDVVMQKPFSKVTKLKLKCDFIYINYDY